MLNRAYRLSSSWKLFTNECEKLKRTLINLKYPENLVSFTIATFLNSVMLSDQIPAKADTQAKKKMVRIALHTVLLTPLNALIKNILIFYRKC